MEKEQPNVLKPAIKTLEGQLFLGVASVASVSIFKLTGIDVSNLLTAENLDKALSLATSVDDIVKAHKLSEVTLPQAIMSLSGTLKLGILLAFLYKILSKYIDKRVDLKKEFIQTLKVIKDVIPEDKER